MNDSVHSQGIMTIPRQWIQPGVLAVVLGGLIACAMIASPPEGLIAQNDHAALATWYDKEAAHLRQHAKEMMMAEEYRKNPDSRTRGCSLSENRSSSSLREPCGHVYEGC